MNPRLLFLLVIIAIVAIGVYFYYNPSEGDIGEGIEIVSTEIVPDDKQIEIVNADIDTKYDANIVLNDLKRDEFVLTLYLSNISSDEAPDILSTDIYAYISSNNENIFGESSIQKYSENTDKIAVSLVMDYSGSMENNFPEMEKAVKTFIYNFGIDDLAEVIKFGSNIEQLSNFSSDKNYISKVIYSNSQMRGETSFYAAINMGLDDFSKIDKYFSKGIVAFADGQDNNSEQYGITYESVIEKANRQKIPIFTVGLQDPQIPQFYLDVFKQTLGGLANESGGFNYLTTDPTKLTELYNKINTSLRNSYVIKIKWDANKLPSSGSTGNLFVRVMSIDKAIATVNKPIIIP